MSAGKVMLGLAILADVQVNARAWPEFMQGRWDDEIRHGLFHSLFQRYAGPEDRIEDVLAIRLAMEDLRQQISVKVQAVMDGTLGRSFETPRMNYREREQIQKEHKTAATRVNFNAQHAPSAEGTVAELMEKYGVSKSEIRRRKQAGTLHELTPVK